ncbi:hypothetical protein BDQ17DRAFT_240200 [Cyathus striatus]|nr:hypothetical protein BDQ17DRAFT_240200 [Cyathus striatus]
MCGVPLGCVAAAGERRQVEDRLPRMGSGKMSIRGKNGGPRNRVRLGRGSFRRLNRSVRLMHSPFGDFCLSLRGQARCFRMLLLRARGRSISRWCCMGSRCWGSIWICWIGFRVLVHYLRRRHACCTLVSIPICRAGCLVHTEPLGARIPVHDAV